MSESLFEYVTSERVRAWFSVFLYDAPQERRPVGRRLHYLFRNNLLVISTPDVWTLGNAFLAQVEAIRFPERDDAVFAEAALVAANGTASLLPSGTMFWVASLGRAVRRTGLTLPASQYSAIDLRSGLVLPVRPVVTGLRAVDRLVELFGSNEKADRSVVDRPVPVDIVFSVAPEDDPVAPLSKATALVRLAGGVMNLPKLTQTALDGLARFIDQAECYEIPAGKPAEMAEAVARTMTLRGA